MVNQDGKTERQKTTLLNQLCMNKYQAKTSNLFVDKDERYRILTSEFMEIAHLGSFSDENFEKVRYDLNALARNMQTSDLPGFESTNLQ